MNSEWHDAKSSMKFFYRFIEEKVVDGISFGRLEVRWPNGSTGAYFDVNRRTYDDLVKADSRGKFLNSQIKPNFKYERIQEPEQDEESNSGSSKVSARQSQEAPRKKS
jgi:hypothetical protein